jgi:hypothetical protein
MTVCIKKFPHKLLHANTQREIDMLKQVANNEDAITNGVIRFLGTDIDRKGGTVLIFEMVCASSFNSDLHGMTAQNIADYMYKQQLLMFGALVLS